MEDGQLAQAHFGEFATLYAESAAKESPSAQLQALSRA